MEVVRALLRAGANKEAENGVRDKRLLLNGLSTMPSTPARPVRNSPLRAGPPTVYISCAQTELRPVHLAVKLGQVQVLRALLEAGADKNALCKVRLCIVHCFDVVRKPVGLSQICGQ